MKLETEIRNLKRKLHATSAARDCYLAQAIQAELEAKNWEQEAKKWECRFDVAMSKIPGAVNDE